MELKIYPGNKKSQKNGIQTCVCHFFVVPLQPQRFRIMNDYRFINIDQEPTEEQLAQLMHEVAVEAKERHDRAHAAYFAHIRQMAQAL